MGSAAYSDLRRNNAALSPPTVALIEARVVAAPASAADYVRVQEADDTSGLYLGEASWPSPAGGGLPAAGDECLVAVSNRRRPWVVAWAVPNW